MVAPAHTTVEKPSGRLQWLAPLACAAFRRLGTAPCPGPRRQQTQPTSHRRSATMPCEGGSTVSNSRVCLHWRSAGVLPSYLEEIEHERARPRNKVLWPWTERGIGSSRAQRYHRLQEVHIVRIVDDNRGHAPLRPIQQPAIVSADAGGVEMDASRSSQLIPDQRCKPLGLPYPSKHSTVLSRWAPPVRPGLHDVIWPELFSKRPSGDEGRVLQSDERHEVASRASRWYGIHRFARWRLQHFDSTLWDTSVYRGTVCLSLLRRYAWRWY